MSSSDATTRLLVDLIAGRTPSPEGIDWSGAVDRLEALGLEGVAVASHRSSPFLPPSVADALEPAYLARALHTSLTVESARRALDALDGAGVPALLYKGAALVVAGVYDDPGARAMDDADLLVSPDRAEDAVRALRGAGFAPWVEWDPDTVEWLDSATFRDARAPGGTEIDVDLHWRLGYGGLRYGADRGRRASGSEEEWLRGSADRIRRVPAPGPHLLLVVEHVLKHLHVRVHLPGLLDAVRLSREVDDWASVRAALVRRPGGGSVAALLDVVREGFGAAIPREAFDGPGLGGAPLLARWVLTPGRLLGRAAGEGPRLRGLLQRWLLAGSARRTLAEIRATVLPGARWLRARYGESGTPGRGYPLGLLLRYWAAVIRWLLGRGVSPVSPNQEFEA